METNSFENAWAEYSQKLQSGLHLNIKSLNQIQFGKARSELRKLFIRRIVENVVFLLLFVLLLRFVLLHYPVLEYVVSALILAIFACVGFIGGLRQVMLISRLDYSGPVTAFQTEMEKLKAYSLQTLKLLLMSFPFYFAYVVIGFKFLFGLNVIRSADPKWLVVNLCLSLILMPITIWVVGKMGYRSKARWMRNIIRDNGGKEIHASLEFLAELEAYQKEGNTASTHMQKGSEITNRG